MASTEDRSADRRPMTVEISNAVVQTVREYTGRGPTKARAEISDHLVTCLLGDSLTKGEHTLVEHGRQDHVLRTRAEYQEAMGQQLIDAVQRITQRNVLAYMSANHIDPDLGIETFVMELPSQGADVP